MTTGYTITGSLADSLPTYIASARNTRQYEGVMQQLCDRQTLDKNTGLNWAEITVANLTAQPVTETTLLENPQQLSDSMISITPTMIGVNIGITDRVKARISKVALAKTAGRTQAAIELKKDQDGLVALDGATTSLCGAGNTLTSGHIGTAVFRITSNASEPGKLPINCVLHGYQIKDLYDEIIAAVGTYEITQGETARAFREGFKGNINGARIFEDGNITIDTSDDAKGGVFAKEGLILVQGRSPRVVTVRNEAYGGGADIIYHYDEYAYGERSEGNWIYEIYSDATVPTS